MQGHLLDELRVGAHESIELGSIGQSGEGATQGSVGVAMKVPLAGESGEAGENGEGCDLAGAEGGIRSWASALFGSGLVEVVHYGVECGEEGVHIEHEESVPFPSGLGSKPTLERGHLPLKHSRIIHTKRLKVPKWPMYGYSIGLVATTSCFFGGVSCLTVFAIRNLI
jgi:hypothetical protein